jgi:hypothetical protein
MVRLAGRAAADAATHQELPRGPRNLPSGISPGDRIRVTAKCRVRGVTPGESGMVLRVIRRPRRRPQTGVVATYVVKLDRGDAVVAFYPGEVERA